MFKKTIKFENFNGVEVERDFYFHLSKAELAALATDADSMQERIKRIQETKDVRAVINEFREIIKLSVGVRSEDGERFIKDGDAQSSLLDSPAFDELLFGLIQEPNAAADFIKQLVPEKLQKQLEEEIAKNGGAPDPFKDPQDDRPAYQKEHRLPTSTEMRDMTQPQMNDAWRWREENGL